MDLAVFKALQVDCSSSDVCAKKTPSELATRLSSLILFVRELRIKHNSPLSTIFAADEVCT